MTTYDVRTPAGRLSREQKAQLVTSITTTHSEIAKIRPNFVHVMFHEINPDDIFIGGKSLDGEFLFIQAHMRSGRTAVERGALIRKLVPAVMDIAAMPRHAIWVYLSELSSRSVVEYGHILPEAGSEDDWLAALSSEERDRVEGRTP